MSDFKIDKNGRYLRIRMVKTKEPLKILIPDVAFGLVPDTEDDNLVFSLPKNDYANQALRRWLEDAGITDRKITFHCARHSAATILYSQGVPLQVIQKQLGHIKASTTEIYSNLMDDAQREASNTMDKTFGKEVTDGK
jgi:integrase